MTQDKKILDFAMKYYYLYLNPQTTEGEVTNGFAEACRDLGFSPEGNPYELLPDRRKAGYVFLSEEDAERILENLVDPCTLGSRIFSRWQTTVQRKKEGWKVRLTSHKSRKCFTTAFFLAGHAGIRGWEKSFCFPWSSPLVPPPFLSQTGRPGFLCHRRSGAGILCQSGWNHLAGTLSHGGLGPGIDG